MRTLFIAAAAFAALSAPAAAQPAYGDPRDAEIMEVLPSQAEIDRTTHALDRVLGALLDVDIAPVVEAVDPHRAYPAERTLREMAERDDPWFEDRLRHDLYGVSAGMGRMMQALAALTPVLRHTLEEASRDVEDALEGYPRP